MKIVGVIPSRFGSTRFPGKPLELIAGKTLLSRVIEGVKSSEKLSQIIVATDDERIATEAKKSGVDVAMTSVDLPTGTDRVQAAIATIDADVVVNIQGDEPLIEGHWVDQLVAPFLEEQVEMTTLGKRVDSLEALESANTAKIVLDQRGNALYFSRLPIPFTRENPSLTRSVVYKHIGLYAYSKNFLNRFCEAGPCELEQAEGLEQLRALYLGAKIRVVEVDVESWGVDTPEDVLKIEELLSQK